MDPAIRNGIVLPHQIFCNNCLRRMDVRPATNRTTLFNDTSTATQEPSQGNTPGLRAQIHEAMDPLPQFESWGLRFVCPTCDSSGATFSWEYTQEEAEWVTIWHNADDYASDREREWARLHEPAPGFAAQAMETLLARYPLLSMVVTRRDGWDLYNECLTAADPCVSEGKPRDWPLEIGLDDTLESVLSFGPSHFHVEVSPQVGESFQEAATRWIERLIIEVGQALSGESVFYVACRGEKVMGGGHFTPYSEENMAHLITNASGISSAFRPDTIRLFNWPGDRDQSVQILQSDSS